MDNRWAIGVQAYLEVPLVIGVHAHLKVWPIGIGGYRRARTPAGIGLF